jgi:amidase
MPWRYNDEDALKAKLRSSGLTVGYYNCDGNVSF